MEHEKDDFDKDYEKHFNELPPGEYMMVNSLTRIAKDLERTLVGIFTCAGLLGLIAFVLLYRWFFE